MAGAGIAVVAILAASPPARAAQEIRLELNLRYQGSRDYTFVKLLDRSESTGFESDGARAIRPFVEEARKKLALKEGYQPDVYGPTYFQLITIDRIHYRVTDADSGRTVSESEGKQS